MNAITPTTRRREATFALAAGAAVLLLMCGCHKAVSTEGKPASAAAGEAPAKAGASDSESDAKDAKDKGSSAEGPRRECP
jgi:hypothetical protein